MKKIKMLLIVAIYTLIIISLSAFKIHATEVEPKFNVYIMMNEKSEITMDEFLASGEDGYSYYLDLYIEAIGTERQITGLQADISIDTNIFEDPGQIWYAADVKYKANATDTRQKTTQFSQGGASISTIMIVTPADNFRMDPGEKYKLGRLNFWTKEEVVLDSDDYLEIGLDFTTSSGSCIDDRINEVSVYGNEINSVKLTIGTPPDVDNTSISSVTATGTNQDGTSYSATASINGTNIAINNVPYLTAKEGLTVNLTPGDNTATLKKDGTTVSGNSFTTGSLTETVTYTVTVSVGSTNTDYTLTISVKAPTDVGSGSLYKIKSATNVNSYTTGYQSSDATLNLSDFSKESSEVSIETYSGFYLDSALTTTSDTNIITVSSEGGSNTYTFTVYDEQGGSKGITITVNRPESSSENSIVEMKVNNVSATLESSIYTYGFSDESKASETYSIFIKTSDSSVINFNNEGYGTTNQITISDKSISYGGETTYTIKVKAQSGVEATYTLKVTKAKSTTKDISVKITLGESVKSYDLSSTGTTSINYELGNTDETDLGFEITKKNEFQSYEVIDLGDIPDPTSTNSIRISSLTQENNTFKIKVTAQDGNTYTYDVTIKRLSGDTSLTDFYIRDNGSTTYYLEYADFQNLTPIVAGSGSEQTYTYYIDEFSYDVKKIYLYVQVNNKATITSASSNASQKEINGNTEWKSFVFEFTDSKGEDVNFSFVVQAANGNKVTYVIEMARAAADSDSTLKLFQYNGINVPNWSSAHKGTSNVYNVQIAGANNPSIDLQATATSSKAKIEYTVDGVTKAYEDNTIPNATISFTRNKETAITVKVTAEDGTYSTFIIKILSANSDASIKSIKLDGIDGTIDLTNTSQTFEVAHTLASTKLTVTPNDANATITGSTGDWTLSDGENKRTIIVTSEDGKNTKEFTIIINRQAARSQKNLKSLTVNGNAISIDTSVTEYKYRVDNDIESVMVIATIPSDNGSKITNSDNEITSTTEYNKTVNISSGSYKDVNISVQAENGTTITYKVTVYRANNEATLSSVLIDNKQYTIDKFDSSNTLELSEVRNSVSSLSLEFIIPTVEKSTIKILSGEYSQNGSQYSWNLDVTKNGGKRDFALRFQVISQYAGINDSEGYKSPIYTITVTKEAASTTNILRDLEVIINGTDYFDGKTIQSDLGKLIVGSNDVNLVEIYAYILKTDYSEIVGFTDNVYEDGEYVVYKKTLSGTAIDSQVVINVVSEAGGTNPYYLNIVRKNQINDIEGISIDNVSIDLSKTFPMVLDAVRYDKASLKFTITKKDPKSVLYINGTEIGSNNSSTQDYTYTLVDGENTIKVQLRTEYENGELCEGYIFTIHREPASTKITLDKLEVNIQENETSKAIINYKNGDSISKVRINNDIESATVTAYLLKSNYSKIKDMGLATEVTIDSIVYQKYESIFTFTASEEKISITVYSEDESYSQTYDFPITRKNNNNTFTNISVEGFDSITFAKDTVSYDLDSTPYKQDKIYFNTEMEDDSATLFIKLNNNAPTSISTNGVYGSHIEVSLATGDNTITLYLVSEYGTKGTEYVYIINRESASSNNQLSKLEFNSNGENFLSEYFQETSLQYVLYIDRDTYNNSFTVNATAADVNASVEIVFDSSKAGNSLSGVLLSTKINEIKVNVTAEDGSSKATYIVYVYYASNNYAIDKIEIDGEDIYASGVKELTRTWDIDTFELEVTPKSSNAKVEITNSKINGEENTLVDGNNKFNITVISELGKIYDSTKVPLNTTISKMQSDTYKVNIIKDTAYTNTNLGSLVVKNKDTNATIAFDSGVFIPDTKNYIITLTDETVKNIKIEYTKLNEDKQTVTINNGAEISEFVYTDGKLNVIIPILVEAQGTSEYYKINFKKGIDLSNNVGYDAVSLYDLNDNTKTNLITFDPTSTNTLNVGYKVSSVVLDVKTNDSKATVKYVDNTNSNVYALTANSDNTIKFYILAEDGVTKSDTYTIIVHRAQASTDVSLKNIILKNLVTGETVTPYNTLSLTGKEIDIYISGDVAGVEIILEPNDVGAVVPVNNAKEPLTRGEKNTFVYYVKSEDESITKQYKLNIYPGEDDAEAVVSEILIGSKKYTASDFTFDEATNTYTLENVAYASTSADIKFNASKNSTLYNTTENVELNASENTFEFENISENNRNTKKVKVVIKKVDPDTVNTLDSLSVDGYGFVEGAFSSSKLEYTVTLPLEADVTSLKVLASPTSTKAIVEGFTSGYRNYSISKNEAGLIIEKLQIKVTAENGDEKIYIINVIQANTDEKSDDVTYNSVSLYDFNDNTKTNLITFDPTSTNTLNVGYKVSKVVLDISLHDSKASVKYVDNGNSNVFALTANSDNTIKFYILAEDGVTKSDTYTIIVHRAQASTDASLKDIKLKNSSTGESITPITSIDLSKEVIDIYINRDITSVTVELVPTFNGAIIPVNNVAKTVTRGQKTAFNYYVKSEDESITKPYTINVISGSDGADITDLNVAIGGKVYDKTKFAYDSATNTYTLENIAYKEIAGIITFTASDNSTLYNTPQTVELNALENSFEFENISENNRNTKKVKVVIKKVDPDTVNTLDSLSVDGYGFVEGAFRKTKTNYTVTLPLEANVTSLKVMAARTSEKSTITGFVDGVRTYSVSKNDAGLIVEKLEVEVVAEDGSKCVYTINVIQANTDEKSDDKSLKENPIIYGNDDKAYPFDPNSSESIKVDYEDEYIDLSEIANDSKATVLPQVVKLQEGRNEITFEVIAEDGSSQEYTLNIEREVADSDNTLKNLKVKYQGEVYSFITDGNDKTILNYTLTLEKTAKYVELVMETNSNKALISQDYSGGINLDNSGTTNVLISVVAQNKSVRNYNITITTLDTSADVEIELTDKDGVPFEVTIDESDPKNLVYTLPDLTYANGFINVNIKPKNSYVKYDTNLVGAHDLVVGDNQFVITATSEDGKTTITHTIKVKRLNGTDTTQLTNLIVTSLNGEPLLDDFSPNIFAYTIKLPVEFNESRVIIDYEIDDENSTVTGDLGEKILDVVDGAIFSKFTIKVTSEIGTEQSYVLTIVKSYSDDLSSDNGYKSIKIKSIVREKSYEYFQGSPNPITIDAMDERVQIIVELNSEKAKVISSIDLSNIYLPAGEEVATIIHIQAEDGTNSEAYEIRLKRTPKSNNNKLGNLSINGDNIPLSNDTYKYIYYVRDEVTDKLRIAASPDDVNAKLNIPSSYEKDFSLSTYTDEIVVVVTAEDGSTQTYLIEVVRESITLDLSYVKVDENEVSFEDNEATLDDHLYSQNHISLEVFVQNPNAKLVLKMNDKKTSVGNEINTEFDLVQGDNELEIYAYTDTGVESEHYFIYVKRLDPSTNNALKSLRVFNDTAGTEYVIDFDKDNLNYIIEETDVNNLSSLRIVAEAGDIYQKIEGAGFHAIDTGSIEGTTVVIKTVKVTAEDGSTREYKITIAKKVEPNSDISVEEFSLTGNDNINYLGTSTSAKMTFNTQTKEYTINVPYKLNNLTISVYNPNTNNIVYSVDDTVTTNRTFLLQNKSTKISFYIISKDGSTNNRDNPYIINVVKSDPKTDASLVSLKLDGTLISGFDSTVTLYNINVEASDANKVNIDAISSDSNATIEGLGEFSVVLGMNTFRIKVTAEDGVTTKTYTVIINSLRSENEILDIKIEDYELDKVFSKDITTYQLSVEYSVEYIKFLVSYSEGSTISVNGLQKLSVGLNRFEIYATAENGNVGTKYIVDITRKDISTDATLKDLVIKDGGKKIDIPFNPGFDPYIKNYTINLDSDELKDLNIVSIDIDATANNQYATVGGLGYQNLAKDVEGVYQNVFKIVVRAQSGATETYTLNVYKGVDLSSDISLDDVTMIGNDAINYLGMDAEAVNLFSLDTSNYQFSVPYNVDSLSLVFNTRAYVDGAGTKSFGSSNKLNYNVRIYSMDGTNSKSFTIEITREEALGDNSLANIKVLGKELIEFDENQSFDKDKLVYEIRIPYGTTNNQAILAAVPTDSSSKVTINGKRSGETFDLIKGKNFFSIVVLAQDGTTRTYTLTIIHSDSNALLQDLSIEGYALAFDPETFEYTLVVDPSVTEISIKASAQDSNASIIGASTKKLSGKSDKFEVNVISEDGLGVSTYVINVSTERIPSSETRLKSLNIEGLDLKTFSSDNREYKITASKSLKNVSVDATPMFDGATVEVSGEGDLFEGNNVILIKVTAEDGSEDYYRINVYKEATPDYFFIILLIATFILWLITILVIIIRHQLHKREYQDRVNYY